MSHADPIIPNVPAASFASNSQTDPTEPVGIAEHASTIKVVVIPTNAVIRHPAFQVLA